MAEMPNCLIQALVCHGPRPFMAHVPCLLVPSHTPNGGMHRNLSNFHRTKTRTLRGCRDFLARMGGMATNKGQPVMEHVWHGSLNVPIFHITQPLDSMIGIWSIMATIFGDVQYTQVMGHLTTPGIFMDM